MTRNRSWLALGALLVALAGGALWAADQEKKTGKAPALGCCAEEKGCCAEKCCAPEKAKNCCADGKCCGCCDKAPQTATLPVPAGSAIQVMIAPPGAFEGGCAQDWACPALSMTPLPPAPVCQPACPVQFTPVTQYAPHQEMSSFNRANGPVQFTPVTQYAPPPCVMPPPPPVVAGTWAGRPTPWRVCVVQEGGKSCLGMQVGVSKDTSATCESMTLKAGDLKLSVVGKQVQVSGKCVKATADSVCWSAENGNIVLDGSVKLKYEGDAHKAEISAVQVVVGVADGHIEVMGAGSIAPRSVPANPTSPSLSTPVRCPACPSSATECPQVFNFWTGFFH